MKKQIQCKKCKEYFIPLDPWVNYCNDCIITFKESTRKMTLLEYGINLAEYFYFEDPQKYKNPNNITEDQLINDAMDDLENCTQSIIKNLYFASDGTIIEIIG